MNDREARFRALYSDHVDAVLGYALRRVDRPEDAADVVADTFLAGGSSPTCDEATGGASRWAAACASSCAPPCPTRPTGSRSPPT